MERQGGTFVERDPPQVIVGEYEFGPGIASDIADRLPRGEVQGINDASHAVLWDAPDFHADIVGDFLDRTIA